MQKLISFLSVLFFFTPDLISQEGFSLIQADESSVTLSFEPKWLSENAVEIDGKTFTSVSFFGGISDKDRVGLPDLPSILSTIIVGSENKPRVDILSIENLDTKKLDLAPVPILDKEGNTIYERSERYATAPIPETAEASLPEHARGYLISTVRISPLSYNPITQTLKRFKKIVIRISFDRYISGISATSPLNSTIRPLGQPLSKPTARNVNTMFSNILNFQTAKNWQFPVLKNSTIDTVRESVLRSGRFYKLELREEGVYRLDRSYLESIGINVGSIDPRKIKVYFNGGEELDTRVNSVKIPDLQESRIFVQGESDGSFDNGDFILFYAKSVQGIFFNTSANPNRLAHYNHHFSQSAFAFLSLDGENGKRIQSISSLESPTPFSPASFQTLSFIENDRVHFTNYGIHFYDIPLSNTRRTATFQFSTEDIENSRPANFRGYFKLASPLPENFSVRYNSETVVQQTTFSSTINTYVSGSVYELINSNVQLQNQSQTNLELTYSANSAVGSLYPDWMELTYWKRFQAQNNFLKFNNRIGLSSSTVVSYSLTGFSNTPRIWEVTTINDAREITGINSASSFQQQESPSVYREYIAFTENYSFKRPVSASLVQNQNIRSLSQQGGTPEYIIIYPKEFETAAQTLYSFRSDAARWGALRLKCAMTSTEQIYNEFSGGKQDFTAIRNFIKYLYDNAPSVEQAPTYVVLLGDGDWDYRNLTGRIYPKVPAFASTARTYELSAYNCSDDFYVAVQGEDFRPELAIGRITVQTANEANFAVQKIINYETNSDFGDWRNRLGLVADDYPNGSERFPSHTRDRFTFDSEATLRSALLQAPYINGVKLYAPFYRPESAAGGRRFPALYNDIINQLNSGMLITNFIGHGNPNVWTAERIFEPSSSLRLLTNTRRLTFGITATCDFGRADDPFFQSGAEQMFISENGGAVGLITTSRAIFVTSGSSAPPSLVRELFSRDSNGLNLTVGESFYRFKLNNPVGNDVGFFFLLGDPAMRLLTGRTIAKIDSLNGVLLTEQLISIPALSRTTISGSIRTFENNIVSSFSGKIATTIFDAARPTPADHEGNDTVDTFYDVRNAIIYRGSVTVQNGRFTVNFIVPKDISYDSINSGRISLYAWKEGENLGDINATAAGATNQVIFSGTNPDAAIDNTPPIATIYFNDRSFASGGITNQSPLFVAELSDENGINLTQSIGRALTLTLNENEQNPIVLNDFYEAKEGSFTDGEIRYQFRDLRDGRYSLRFKAWDNFNNSTEQFLDFTVSDSSKLSLGQRIFNYPNPFRNRTTFVVEHNRPNDDMTVQIKIYTVAGRLIRTLRDTQSQYRINLDWDAKDEDGNDIANGIYLYKVILSNLSGNFRAEKIEKLAIIR